MDNRGGKRPGAGRKRGVKDRATGAQLGTIAELARTHTDTALNALVSVASNPNCQDGARVSAASVLLDRGYGKPAQPHTGGDGGAILLGWLTDQETKGE